MDTEIGKNSQRNQQSQPEFAIQRIYIKDLSFEAPNIPNIFKDDWEPEVKFDLQSESQKLEEDIYEVSLAITVTVNNKTKMAYLVEIKHGGIFTIKNFQKEQLDQVLGSLCPAIIYPYVREIISDVAVRGSFPPLYLAPINFDALYGEHLKQKETEMAGEKTEQ